MVSYPRGSMARRQAPPEPPRKKKPIVAMQPRRRRAWSPDWPLLVALAVVGGAFLALAAFARLI